MKFLTERFNAYNDDYYRMKIKVISDHKNGCAIEVEILDCYDQEFDSDLVDYAKYLQWKYNGGIKHT